MVNGKNVVLLVEDEMLIAEVATDALNDFGFEVRAAITANSALDVARSGEKFALAVVDLGLPDRPGQDLVSDLKALDPELPIIVASGQSEATAQAMFKNLKGVAILPKPYVFSGLRNAIVSLGLIPSGQ